MTKTNNNKKGNLNLGLEVMEKYLDELLKTAEFDSLPEDYLKDYKKDLFSQIQDRVGVAIMAKLDDKGLLEYMQLVKKLEEAGDKAEPREIEDFLKQHELDYAGIIKEEMDAFAKEYLTNAARLRVKTGQ